MISYALSVSAFGNYITESAAAAVRQSKFRNFEPYLATCIDDDDVSLISKKLTRQLIEEGVFHTASMHLPFCGKYCWDSSSPDETIRKDVSERLIRLIRDHADLMGPMVTLHAGGGSPQSEHLQRIGQVCKTIEEMLPTARELGFMINVEFLPRTCLGNSPEELLRIVSNFDEDEVGICLDVNHIMDRYKDLPEMINMLAPRIRSFHLCDYDGIDETHWIPGQGIINWPELMRHIRAIDHDVLLILEPVWQLKRDSRPIDPLFAIRQNEKACWFLENCEKIMPEISTFQIPGNQGDTKIDHRKK